MKESILVSVCLFGEHVRYDGAVLPYKNELLEKWQKEGEVRTFCPEVEGGLPVPRSPAEIVSNNKVVTRDGKNVTENFLKGAQKGLEMALKHEVKLAILKDGSPSCGISYIYDGTFSGKQIAGKGFLARLLEKNGIPVFSEREIEAAAEYLA